MPYLFHETTDGRWNHVEIIHGLCVLVDAGEIRFAEKPKRSDLVAFAIVPHGTDVHTYFSLISSHKARINGHVVHSLHVLDDRDEIFVLNHRFCFSAQTIAVVEPFNPVDPGKRYPCPICSLEVGRGDASLRCPGCGIVQHGDCWNSVGGKCATYGCSFHMHDNHTLWEPEAEPTRQQAGGVSTRKGHGA